MPNSLKCKIKRLCHNGTLTERERDRLIQALEQEPCEDRMKYVQETVNTMMDTCTTNSIKDKVFRNAARFVQNAIDGKEPDFERIDEPEPCEDAVSRKAVLEITAETGALETQARVKSLPPVTPKQRTGRWIKEFNDIEGEVRFTCSSCGEFQLFGTDFCYYCGAKMEGVSE